VLTGRRDAQSRLAGSIRWSRCFRACLGRAIAVFFVRASRAHAEKKWLLGLSRVEALRDALTGLRNRRALMSDLPEQLAQCSAADHKAMALVILDLDGFKSYNDSFGHPAGDPLLVRLSERLTATIGGIGGIGHAYRMGGDEFCVLAPVSDDDDAGAAIAGLAAAALSDDGEGFQISCSYGLARLPAQASSPEDGLRLADQRMYEQKVAGRVPARRQTRDVLLGVLAERSVALQEHESNVATLARLTAEQLGLG
jgi:two-component system cell cycle response regulator